jgi:hypothetical protein
MRTNNPIQDTAQSWVEQDGDKASRRFYVELEGVGQLAKHLYAYATEHPNDSWTFGSLNAQTSRRAIALGSAPEHMLKAYLEERGKLEPAIEQTVARAVSTRRRRKMRLEGDEPDVDRVLAGIPECWETRVRGAMKRKVTLGIQAAWISATDEDVFIRCAARATAASDILQRLGYAVEIKAVGWFTPITYGRMQSYFTETCVVVPLKNAQQPLDASAVLVAGLPGFLRDHIFEIVSGKPQIKLDLTQTTSKGAPPWSREVSGVDYVFGENWEQIDGQFAFDPVLEGFFRNIA